MNQEYQRQIIKKLLWLSDYLVSEFDMNSENYRGQHIRFQERRIKEIYGLLKKAKSTKDVGVLLTETNTDPWLIRQLNTARLIETDPFLPKKIRMKVSKFYSDRAVDLGLAYSRAMQKYCRELYNGKLKANREEVDMKIRIEIGEEYSKVKWAWEDAEKKINQLRTEIEKYLASIK